MIAILLSICLGYVGLMLASMIGFEIFVILGMVVGALSPLLYMTEKIYKVKTKEIHTLQLKIKDLEKQLEDKNDKFEQS